MIVEIFLNKSLLILHIDRDQTHIVLKFEPFQVSRPIRQRESNVVDSRACRRLVHVVNCIGFHLSLRIIILLDHRFVAMSFSQARFYGQPVRTSIENNLGEL